MRLCINKLDNEYLTKNEIYKLNLTRKEIALKIKELIKQKKDGKGYYKVDSEFIQYQVKTEDMFLYIKKKNKRFKRSLPLVKSNTIKLDIANIVFEKWFNKNQYRFNTKPIISKQTKDGFIIEFEGIIKNISIIVRPIPEVSFIFEYDGEWVDSLDIAYIGQEMYNPEKGYYDSDRVNGIFTYFDTREELYINDVFEPLIEYCNEYLTDKHSLYMCISQGFSYASIDFSNDNDCKRRHFSNKDELNKITSVVEGKKLYLEDKAIKKLKFDLFDLNKEIDINYIKNLNL